jgi:hypothetical protein
MSGEFVDHGASDNFWLPRRGDMDAEAGVLIRRASREDRHVPRGSSSHRPRDVLGRHRDQDHGVDVLAQEVVDVHLLPFCAPVGPADHQTVATRLCLSYKRLVETALIVAAVIGKGNRDGPGSVADDHGFARNEH